LNIASELVLRAGIRTVCIGGVARPESYELHGPFASRVRQDLLLHHLFLGVNAISADEGASCEHLGESSISAEMVSRAQRVSGRCPGTPTPPAAAGRSRTRSAPARP
jgi:DeoR family transcriptional regulator of aga operon